MDQLSSRVAQLEHTAEESPASIDDRQSSQPKPEEIQWGPMVTKRDDKGNRKRLKQLRKKLDGKKLTAQERQIFQQKYNDIERYLAWRQSTAPVSPSAIETITSRFESMLTPFLKPGDSKKSSSLASRTEVAGAYSFNLEIALGLDISPEGIVLALGDGSQGEALGFPVGSRLLSTNGRPTPTQEKFRQAVVEATTNGSKSLEIVVAVPRNTDIKTALIQAEGMLLNEVIGGSSHRHRSSSSISEEIVMAFLSASSIIRKSLEAKKATRNDSKEAMEKVHGTGGDPEGSSRTTTIPDEIDL